MAQEEEREMREYLISFQAQGVLSASPENESSLDDLLFRHLHVSKQSAVNVSRPVSFDQLGSEIADIDAHHQDASNVERLIGLWSQLLRADDETRRSESFRIVQSKILSRLAYQLYKKRDYLKAIACWMRMSLSTPNELENEVILRGLAQCNAEVGCFGFAESWIVEAIKRHRETKKCDDYTYLLLLGQYRVFLGKFSEAIRILEAVEAYAMTKTEETWIRNMLVASALLAFARLHVNFSSTSNIRDLEAAYDQLSKANIEPHLQSILMVAVAQEYICGADDFDSGLSWLRKASEADPSSLHTGLLHYFRALQPENNVSEYEDFDKALHYLQQALQAKEGDPSMTATCCCLLSSVVYLKARDGPQAWTYLEKAISMYQKVNDISNVAGCYHRGGEIFIAEGNLADGIKQLQEANRLYCQISSSLTGDKQLLSYRDNMDCTASLQLALLMSEQPLEALRVSDEGRSHLLARKRKKVETSSQTAECTSAEDSEGLQPVLIGQIAAKLRSTILFFSDIRDKIFCWVIKPGAQISAYCVSVSGQRGACAAHEAIDTDALKRKISIDMKSQCRTVLVRPKVTRTTHEPVDVRFLANQLPRESDGKVILVLSDAVHDLRFASKPLPNEDGSVWISRYVLSVAPSIHILDATLRQQQTDDANRDNDWQRKPLVVGINKFDGPRRQQLNYAVAEANVVCELLKPGKAHEPLLDEAATKYAILQGLESCTLFHVASHAGSNVIEEAVISGAIRLGSSNDADKYISADDVAKLNLSRARLAFLNCCLTGDGTFSKREGVLSLGMAFLAAGVKEVVVARDRVDDSGVARLVKAFYINYKETHAADVALQKAQQALHADGTNPKQWDLFYVLRG